MGVVPVEIGLGDELGASWIGTDDAGGWEGERGFDDCGLGTWERWGALGEGEAEAEAEEEGICVIHWGWMIVLIVLMQLLREFFITFS